MNPSTQDRTITQKLKIVKPKDTPSALADELAKADAALAAAKQQHEASRASVVEKGVERGKRLRELRREIEAEEAQVAAVVNSARNSNPAA